MKINYVSIVVWLITFFLLFLVVFNLLNIFNKSKKEGFPHDPSFTFDSKRSDGYTDIKMTIDDDFINDYISKKVNMMNNIIDPKSLYFFVYDNNVDNLNKNIQNIISNINPKGSSALSPNTLYSLYNVIKNTIQNLYFPKGELVVITPDDISNIINVSNISNGDEDYKINTSIFSMDDKTIKKTDRYIMINKNIIRNSANTTDEIYPLFARVYESNGKMTEKFVLMKPMAIRNAIISPENESQTEPQTESRF